MTKNRNLTEVEKNKITQSQEELIDELPSTVAALSEKLGIKEISVRSRISRLNDRFDSNLVVTDDKSEYYVAERRYGIQNDTDSSVVDSIQEKEDLFHKVTDGITQDETTNKKDLVLSLSDTHIGEEHYPEHDLENERAYNMVMAARAPLKFYEEVKPILEQDNIGQVHLALIGDICDGKGIFRGQSVEQPSESTLRNQKKWAIESLWELFDRLSRHTDTLHIHGIKGNHGDLSRNIDGVSSESNLDIDVLDRLQERIRITDRDDIELEYEASNEHMFTVCDGDYTIYLNHGEEAKIHAYGTSSSEAEWSNWQSKFDNWDIGLRGHYHQYRIESVYNRNPLIMTPSPAPGGQFASIIGTPDFDPEYKLGTVVYVDHESGYDTSELIKTEHLQELDEGSIHEILPDENRNDILQQIFTYNLKMKEYDNVFAKDTDVEADKLLD